MQSQVVQSPEQCGQEGSHKHRLGFGSLGARAIPSLVAGELPPPVKDLSPIGGTPPPASLPLEGANCGGDAGDVCCSLAASLALLINCRAASTCSGVNGNEICRSNSHISFDHVLKYGFPLWVFLNQLNELRKD